MYPNGLQHRKADAIKKYFIEIADLNFKAKNVSNIIEIVLDRTFKDEDKQYQLDIDDVIEEHIYQCVQFFNQDFLIDKVGEDLPEVEGGVGKHKEDAKGNVAADSSALEGGVAGVPA